MPIHSFPEKKVLARASKACLGGRRAADPDPPWTSGSGNLATSSWVPLTGWDWDVPCSQGCIRSVGNRDSLQKKKWKSQSWETLLQPLSPQWAQGWQILSLAGSGTGEGTNDREMTSGCNFGWILGKIGKNSFPKGCSAPAGVESPSLQGLERIWHVALGDMVALRALGGFFNSIQLHVQQFFAFSALLWMEFFCSHNFFLSSLGTGVRSWWV